MVSNSRPLPLSVRFRSIVPQPQYAREELRAEISAMMTGERVGVGHDPQRGAAYVEHWVKMLEEDPREVHRAAAEAQRMSDYLIGRVRERRSHAASTR